MKRIDIFDMDDTLLYTPSFSEFTTEKEGLIDISGLDNTSEFLKKIKNIIFVIASKNIVFKKSGDYILIYDLEKKSFLKSDTLDFLTGKLSEFENGKPEEFSKIYGIPKRNLKELINSVGVKNGLLYIKELKGFHANPDTIGKKVNEEIIDIYNSAKNKMILTGRDFSLKQKIEDRLKDIGLEYPNFGVHCFNQSLYKSIKDFKSKIIQEAIEENGFDEVHFYEDKKSWLDFAEMAIKQSHPEVRFYSHLVDNISNSRKF